MSCFSLAVRFDSADAPALAEGLAVPGLEPLRVCRTETAIFHHRQRRVTPEDAWEAQPLQAAEGRFVLVCDGRLDNRADLAEALGIDPRQQPDSALMLAALIRWREEAAARMIGDFAFAFWDAAARRLLLGRDALGNRAVFWHRGRNGVVVASSLRDLLAQPDVPRDLNLRRLADWAVETKINDRHTVWQAIHRVPAGETLVCTAGGDSAHIGWRADPNRQIRLKSDEAYVAAATDLLKTVIAPRTRVAGALAADATGGLDSALVAVLAAEIVAPNRLGTVTALPTPGDPLSYPASDYGSEADPVATLIRQTPGLVALPVSTDPADRMLDDERFFTLTGMPLRPSHNVGWLLPTYAAVRAAGGQAVLTGLSGNLSLSWDGGEGIGDHLRAGRLWSLWRDARFLGLEALWLNGGRQALPEAWARWRYRRRGGTGAPWQEFAPLRPDFAAAVGTDAGIRARGYTSDFRYPGTSRAVRARLFGVRQAISDQFSAMRDYTGVEMRHPMNDPRFIDFCLALPVDQFLRQGVTRWLARRVAAPYLPAAQCAERRIGAQFPEFRADFARRRDRLHAHLEAVERSATAQAMLDLPRLRAILEQGGESEGLAQLSRTDISVTFFRFLHLGRFIRWAEGGN